MATMANMNSNMSPQQFVAQPARQAAVDPRVVAYSDAIIESIEQHYKLGKKLGEGRFASVYEGRHVKTRQMFAIKVIQYGDLDEEEMDALATECDILRSSRHAAIVGIQAVLSTADTSYVVTELLRGGELLDRILDNGKFSEKDAQKMFARILSAMCHLHNNNIAHRDIKPENIVFLKEDKRSMDVKLIDFGYADRATSKGLEGPCGTPEYVSPEVLQWYYVDQGKRDYAPAYDTKADIWSMGVLLYVMLSGLVPWSAHTEDGLLRQVEKGDWEFFEPEWNTISKEAKDLVTQMLVVDPRKRIDIEKLRSHVWIKKALDTWEGQNSSIGGPPMLNGGLMWRSFNAKAQTPEKGHRVSVGAVPEGRSPFLRRLFGRMGHNGSPSNLSCNRSDPAGEKGMTGSSGMTYEHYSSPTPIAKSSTSIGSELPPSFSTPGSTPRSNFSTPKSGRPSTNIGSDFSWISPKNTPRSTPRSKLTTHIGSETPLGDLPNSTPTTKAKTKSMSKVGSSNAGGYQMNHDPYSKSRI